MPSRNSQMQWMARAGSGYKRYISRLEKHPKWFFAGCTLGVDRRIVGEPVKEEERVKSFQLPPSVLHAKRAN